MFASAAVVSRGLVGAVVAVRAGVAVQSGADGAAVREERRRGGGGEGATDAGEGGVKGREGEGQGEGPSFG